MTDEPIELHGHKSASQRREYALQVEAMRMKILADHLRSVLILLIRRTGQPQTFLKADIEGGALGQSLDSVETEDKAGVVFSAGEPEKEELPDLTQMPVLEPRQPVVKAGPLCIHLWPTDGSKGQCPHCHSPD